MKIILFILILMQTLFVTSCCSKQKMIKITDNLTWVYVDEMNSYLLWNQKVIVGPGSITLKCDKMYAWGMLHEENISTFFLLNLKNGDFIKNPEIRDVVYKYNINVDFNQSYTQTEIFEEHKSMSSIKRLEADIEKLNRQK